MRSLFLKIFLYFLLIILLVSTVAIALTYLRDREFPPLAHQDFARTAIAEYGRDAIHEFEHKGPQDLDAYVERLREQSGIFLVLFDSQGHSLTRRPVPRRMHHMAQRALRSGEVVFPMMGSRNGLAALVKGTSGNAYIVAIALPERPPQRNVFREVTHGFLGWRLLILLGVTALVCYFLARSLTSPIVKLRKATRKVATGDLSVRVGGQIRGRDEISGLARDFDEMAAQIEGLVGSQKRLLRDISHELRSPLTRLGIALELARKQANPESQEKAFARIELEAERMNSMIGQLLELTRLESGAERAEHHQVDLVALLDELVRDAGFEAQSRQCQVSFSVAGEVPLFCGSPELLRRAFENVIRNAVKYTAPGTRVEVKLKAGDGKIWIQILDRGPGVPEETLEKLFTPFYRVADARERESGGTGIGLAIADRSVRLHGGTIRAENRSRGGLKIEISLRATGSSKL